MNFRKKYKLPGGTVLLPDGGIYEQAMTESFFYNRYFAILGANHFDGAPAYINIEDAPHLLIAGQTGSGKSVCIDTIINSLLIKNSPHTLLMYFADPKKIDYIEYRDLPHTVEYQTEESEIEKMLFHVVSLMDIIYNHLQEERLKSADKLRNPYPKILVVFDEFATFKKNKRIMDYVEKIVLLGRAAGIHLILGMQRPDSKVVDGQIRANCPVRICLSVQSKIDSRIVLDRTGAELLKGRGDSIIRKNGLFHRQQISKCTEEQTNKIIDFWMAQK